MPPTPGSSKHTTGPETDPKKRLKIIVLSTLIVLLLIWVGIFLVPMLTPKPKAQEMKTAGWVLANELNAALAGEKAFSDTSLSVQSEEPLKLKLHGMVKTQQDLVKVREFLQQLRPEVSPQQYEFDVEVRR